MLVMLHGAALSSARTMDEQWTEQLLHMTSRAGVFDGKTRMSCSLWQDMVADRAGDSRKSQQSSFESHSREPAERTQSSKLSILDQCLA